MGKDARSPRRRAACIHPRAVGCKTLPPPTQHRAGRWLLQRAVCARARPAPHVRCRAGARGPAPRYARRGQSHRGAKCGGTSSPNSRRVESTAINGRRAWGRGPSAPSHADAHTRLSLPPTPPRSDLPRCVRKEEEQSRCTTPTAKGRSRGLRCGVRCAAQGQHRVRAARVRQVLKSISHHPHR